MKTLLILIFFFITLPFSTFAQTNQTPSADQIENGRRLQLATEISFRLTSARAYHKGVNGKEKNLNMAIRYYEEVAGLGHIDSEYFLGLIYQVELKQFDRAFYWNMRASEHGHWNAQLNLAIAYLEGQNIEVDPIQGYKWFKLAYRNSGEVATQLLPAIEQIESQLDKTQISEGQRLADEWMVEFERKKNEPKKKPEIVIEQVGLSTNIAIKGSLQATGNVGCVDITQVSNTEIPPNLFLGFLDCVRKNDYDKGIEMFILAFMFGQFDGHRIEDPTAGSGISQLRREAVSLLTPDQRTSFDNHLKEHYFRASEKRLTFCNKIENIGYPTYHPKYMILVGLSAFDGIEGNGLKHFFEPEEQWIEVATPNCPVDYFK